MYISATLPERLVGTIEVNACQPKVWQRAKQPCAAYSLLQLREACSQHEGGFSASAEPRRRLASAEGVGLQLFQTCH